MLRTFALALLLASSALAQDGTLDPTFGTGGTILTDLGGRDVLETLALQDDGHVVAAGYSQGTSEYNFAIARYTADGTLDADFGDGGIVRLHVGDAPAESALTVLANDTGMLAGGYANGQGAEAEAVLVQFGPGGTPDASFGDDGVAFAGWGTDSGITALARLDDDRILAAGRAGTTFALARYSASGEFDPTFGDDGFVSTDFGEDSAGIRDLVLLPDGRILAVGLSNDFDASSVALARYTPDGDLDPTFGSDGRVLIGPSPYRNTPGYEVLPLPDGRFLVAGSANGTVALWRFLADGTLDSSFGVGGRVVTNVPAGSGGGPFAARDAAGRVVVLAAPVAGTNRNLGVLRLLPDGTVDESFGDGGVASVDLFNVDIPSALLLQPDGNVVVGGFGGPTGTEIDFEVARFLGGTGTASEAGEPASDGPTLEAYPNPATASTTLTFDLPSPADVTLAVFDVLGRRVATLVEGPLAVGTHRLTWTAEGLPSGLYLVRLDAGNTVQTRRLVLAR